MQAPLAEEFLYRAAMLPFLVPALGEMTSVVVVPLYFSVGKSNLHTALKSRHKWHAIEPISCLRNCLI